MSVINLQAIGNLISKMRSDKCMTQQQLADALNVTKVSVSLWESGNTISVDKIQLISRYFGVSINELVEGKLRTESNIDYWKRNYNLSAYKFDDISNIDLVVEYFKRCRAARERFISMLPDWSMSKLNEEGQKEFEYLKGYFKFDTDYLSFLEGRLIVFIGDEPIKKIIGKICLYFGNDLEGLHWELSKTCNANFDDNAELVLKSNNQKALSAYLDYLLQPEKDGLLMNNLTHKIVEKNMVSCEREVDYSNDEIEQIPFFKTMLNSGCNVLKDFKNLQVYVDEENVQYIDGNIIYKDVDDSIVLKKIEMYAGLGEKRNHIISKYWKQLSLKEYRKCIDFEKNEFFISLINDKNDNPNKYYEILTKQGGI